MGEERERSARGLCIPEGARLGKVRTTHGRETPARCPLSGPTLACVQPEASHRRKELKEPCGVERGEEYQGRREEDRERGQGSDRRAEPRPVNTPAPVRWRHFFFSFFFELTTAKSSPSGDHATDVTACSPGEEEYSRRPNASQTCRQGRWQKGGEGGHERPGFV